MDNTEESGFYDYAHNMLVLLPFLNIVSEFQYLTKLLQYGV